MAESKKAPAWKQFERKVAEIYRELGAREVEVDKDIAGNQIDVFARVPRIDGTFSRDIISCKCYNTPVGIDHVREWHSVFQTCIRANEADQAIIVTNMHFTKAAQLNASSVGIHLRTLEQLEWANLDLTPYLEAASAKLKSEAVFSNDGYAPLKFIREGGHQKIGEEPLIEEFLARPSCPLLTILGDYGSGKTTFAKHLFLTFAAKHLNGGVETRIPIYLNLRDYPGQLNVPGFILDVLVNQYNARCPNFAKIRRFIESGKTILIFDAFDEMISRDRYDDTVKNFQSLTQILGSDSKAILTCRTHYFKSPDEIHDAHSGTELFHISNKNRFEIVHVQPFTDADIERVLTALCKDKAASVMAAIRQTYDLMGLAKRPILLQMIALVLDDLVASSEEINITRLYNQYVNQWLLRDDWRVKLSKELRRGFTIAFATEMYIREKVHFTWEEVVAAIRIHFKGTRASLLDEYEHDVRTCSFIRLNGQQFEFAHRSFVEYFVALQLYGDIVKDDPSRLETTTFSPEVIAFLSQHFPTTEVTGTVRRWLGDTRGNSILASNLLGVLAKWQTRLTGPIKGLRIDGLASAAPNFEDSKLEQVIAVGLDWKGVKWRGVQSHEGEWVSNHWSKANLADVEFDDDSFQESAWKNCTFDTVKFKDCRLETSRFADIAGSRIVFLGSKISGCEFKRVKAATRYLGCTIKESVLDSCEELSSCTVENSSLEDLDLLRTVLTGTKFKSCSLRATKLALSNLGGASFHEVDFSDVTLKVEPVRKLKVPPTIVAARNLSDEVRKHLEKCGAEFSQK